MFGNYLKMTIILILITYLTISLINYDSVIHKRAMVDEKIETACAVLADSLDTSTNSLDEFSKGYLSNRIRIDKKYFIENFDDILSYYALEPYLKENIHAILLINGDEIDVYNYKIRKWQPKQFFTVEKSDELIFISSLSEDVYKYNASGDKIVSKASHYSISEEAREDLVINKINQIIGKYTPEMMMNIKNVNESDNSEIFNQKFFNPMDDLTVIVLFEENSRKRRSGLMDYMNYDVKRIVGVTLTK